jgi:hypothetical protein
MSVIKLKYKKFNPETKSGKLFNSLVKEQKIMTTAQIQKQFGIKSVSSAVTEIRQAGFAIYADQAKNPKTGKVVTSYRYDTPSRKMVQIAYKAIAAGLVSEE